MYIRSYMYIGIIIGVHEERHTGVHVVNRSLVHTGSVALSFIKARVLRLFSERWTTRGQIAYVEDTNTVTSVKNVCIFSIHDDVKKTFVSDLCCRRNNFTFLIYIKNIIETITETKYFIILLFKNIYLKYICIENVALRASSWTHWKICFSLLEKSYWLRREERRMVEMRVCRLIRKCHAENVTRWAAWRHATTRFYSFLCFCCVVKTSAEKRKSKRRIQNCLSTM